MALLSKGEFYQRLGQVLQTAREKRGLSRSQAAEELNQIPLNPERHLHMAAVRSAMAAHIRRQKGLTLEQVAERGNLPIEFVRDLEEGKILDQDVYSVYCLSYGLRMSFARFEAQVEQLSNTPFNELDGPIE
jgi:hypothetical protein